MPNEHTIAENLQRLSDAKTAIGNAITAKGGTVTASDGLEEFASLITSIPTGSGIEIAKLEEDTAGAFYLNEAYIINSDTYTIVAGAVRANSGTYSNPYYFKVPSSFTPKYTTPYKSAVSGAYLQITLSSTQNNNMYASFRNNNTRIMVRPSGTVSTDEIFFVAVFK